MSTADEAERNASGSASDSAPKTMESEVGWRNYITEDLPRSVQQSADSAIQSARNIQHSSANHLRSIQDFIPQMGARYKHYEEAFFHQVKDGLLNVKEHPAAAAGVVLSTFLLLRGPRRFLYRQTLGRLQSEEAQFNRAEKSMKEFSISVDLMKKESQKLLERSALAEKDMKRGHFDLTDAGTQIHKLARSVSKAESEAADLMDMLREIPGREALKLRADVASMKSHLRQQSLAMHKRVLKISELGVPV